MYIYRVQQIFLTIEITYVLFNTFYYIIHNTVVLDCIHYLSLIGHIKSIKFYQLKNHYSFNSKIYFNFWIVYFIIIIHLGKNLYGTYPTQYFLTANLFKHRHVHLLLLRAYTFSIILCTHNTMNNKPTLMIAFLFLCVQETHKNMNISKIDGMKFASIVRHKITWKCNICKERSN